VRRDDRRSTDRDRRDRAHQYHTFTHQRITTLRAHKQRIAPPNSELTLLASGRRVLSTTLRAHAHRCRIICQSLSARELHALAWLQLPRDVRSQCTALPSHAMPLDSSVLASLCVQAHVRGGAARRQLGRAHEDCICAREVQRSRRHSVSAQERKGVTGGMRDGFAPASSPASHADRGRHMRETRRSNAMRRLTT
jgi:hypothetical protein